MDEIRDRLRRLYAAIGEALEADLSKFTPAQIVTESWTLTELNFRGGLTQAQIANTALMAIHAMAHLPGHLRRWAHRNGRSLDEIEEVLRACTALQLIIDLSNRDKHGPPRDGGRSGRAPRIDTFERVLRLSGGTVGVQFTPGASVEGSGSAAVVITAQLVASDGSRIADLHELLLEGLAAWESLCVRWGLGGSPK